MQVREPDERVCRSRVGVSKSACGVDYKKLRISVFAASIDTMSARKLTRLVLMQKLSQNIHRSRVSTSPKI